MALNFEELTKEDLNELTRRLRINNAVLLADPESMAWRFAKKIQDYIYKKHRVSLPLTEFRIKKFGAGEFEPKIEGNVRKKDVYFIHDSTKDPSFWTIEICLAENAAKLASAESVTLVLPDMNWSRQDRKEQPHVPISAKKIADIISPGADRIITMDPHSEKIQGFYPESVPLDLLKSFPTVAKHIKLQGSIPRENLVIAATDGGDVERASEYSQALGLDGPIAIIYKERDIITKKIKAMHFIGDVQGKDVLLIDDLTDSGGTNISAGKLAKEHGARRIYSYTTHGLFTKGTEELTNFFDKILTSNTHCYDSLGEVEIIDVSPVFAEAIYRAQVGESISSLFNLENNNH